MSQPSPNVYLAASGESPTCQDRLAEATTGNRSPRPGREPSPDVRLALGSGVDAMYRDGHFIDKALSGGPDVHLASVPKQGTAAESHDLNRAALGRPDVRLAACVGGGGGPMSADAFADHLGKPDNPSVRLAMVHSPAERNGTLDALPGQSVSVPEPPDGPSDRPALLVSYVYLAPFLKNRHRYYFRDWVMDSGAFSAHNSGTDIKLQDYIDCCKRLLAEDPQLTEVFALDVIGDWKASLHNTEEMWKQGVPAIPCFHCGEPWDVLKGMAKDYPKVALGGTVGMPSGKRDQWLNQCFARIWPKKVHGFGISGEKQILKYPFHSVDATNWEIGPCKFGRWNSFGGNLCVRGSKQNLRAEVEWYLKLEHRARQRWRKEMALLEGLGNGDQAHDGRLVGQTGGGLNTSAFPGAFCDPAAVGRPDERLACNGGGQGEVNGALGPPTVRLAHGNAQTAENEHSTALGPPSERLVANAHAGRDDAKAQALTPPGVVEAGPAERLGMGPLGGGGGKHAVDSVLVPVQALGGEVRPTKARPKGKPKAGD